MAPLPSPASRRELREMEELRIPNEATYAPVSLLELSAVAPLAARVLLGATPAGRALQVVSLAGYLGSAAQDWLQRLRVRKIRFRETFGADAHAFEPMPDAARERDVVVLAERLNDGWVGERVPRRELAVLVDHHLTEYIAGITGQRVRTSTELRGFSLVQLVFPFVLGACDVISGDVAILRDTGALEPHIIAHEFCHRKGYFGELEAQALAYLALSGSGEPALVQAALLERLHRNLSVLAHDDDDAFRARLDAAGLRRELADCLLALHPRRSQLERALEGALRALYEQRMRAMGQNGLSDYDVGFTSFLYTVERAGRGPLPAAGRIWSAGEAPAAPRPALRGRGVDRA